MGSLPSVPAASTIWMITLVRSMWRRNSCPRPIPSEAPSISPGISAMTKPPGSFQIHYTQIRIQGREMIVGNLGSGIGHSGQERGFTNMGNPTSPTSAITFSSSRSSSSCAALSRLCILGCLHGTGSIMLVAVTALAAF